MSKKQIQKLVIIIVSFIVLVSGIFSFIFFFDGNSSSDDITLIKQNGGYEQLKSDLISDLKVRDSQAVTIADTLFETLGIQEYQGLENGGLRGNTFIYCDGYKLDAWLKAGDFVNAYIGNVIVYKNPKIATTVVSNATELTYKQYSTMVNTFIKSTDVDSEIGKNLFEKLTLTGINNLTNIKKGKLENVKGFYGEEGMLRYFFTLKNDSFDKIYVVCDGFDPILVYDSINEKSSSNVNSVKVLYGSRQGVANVLAYKVKKLTDLEVVFPSALLNGDDSWLMVKNDGIIYIEVRGEITNKDKKESKNFILKVTEKERNVTYLKIDKKVYVE